jgi:hypothetical protein
MKLSGIKENGRYTGFFGVGAGGPEERRRPGKPRSVWENNIKACVKEIIWHGMH